MRSFVQQTCTEQSLGAVGGAGDGMVNEATGVPGVAEQALSRGRECFQGSGDPAGGVSSSAWPRAECKPPDPICFFLLDVTRDRRRRRRRRRGWEGRKELEPALGV